MLLFIIHSLRISLVLSLQFCLQRRVSNSDSFCLDPLGPQKKQKLNLCSLHEQFKQLLAGSVRSPGDTIGAESKMQLEFVSYKGGAVGKTSENTMNYYNAFSKEVTIETKKGSRTRR